MKLHHVGYLVKDIRKSMTAFEALDYQLDGNIFFDEDRKSDICFMRSKRDAVELIQPRTDSEIFPLLKKFRNSPYHLCFEVDDLDAEKNRLQSRGFLLFKDSSPARAISDSARVAFLNHPAAGIVELVQLE